MKWDSGMTRAKVVASQIRGCKVSFLIEQAHNSIATQKQT